MAGWTLRTVENTGIESSYNRKRVEKDRLSVENQGAGVENQPSEVTVCRMLETCAAAQVTYCGRFSTWLRVVVILFPGGLAAPAAAVTRCPARLIRLRAAVAKCRMGTIR